MSIGNVACGETAFLPENIFDIQQRKQVCQVIQLVIIEIFLVIITFILLGLSKEFDNENRITSDEHQELTNDKLKRQIDLLDEVNILKLVENQW